MSHAAYRIRKRVKSLSDALHGEAFENDFARGMRFALSEAVVIIDEEIEREAEKQFTRPILPQGSYLSGGDGPE